MKIIGHRGAAGLALENSIEAIRQGLKAGTEFIEIDVRLTLDKKIVVIHDDDLKRTYGIDLKVKNNTLRKLRKACPSLPCLSDVLDLLTNKTVIIELKVPIDPILLKKITDKFPKTSIRYASFDHSAITAIKKAQPESFCYLLDNNSPLDVINYATRAKMDGIGINFRILNLLTYHLAGRKNLEIYIYTLNNPIYAKIINFFYPKVDICTNYPDKLIKSLNVRNSN